MYIVYGSRWPDDIKRVYSYMPVFLQFGLSTEARKRSHRKRYLPEACSCSMTLYVFGVTSLYGLSASLTDIRGLSSSSSSPASGGRTKPLQCFKKHICVYQCSHYTGTIPLGTTFEKDVSERWTLYGHHKMDTGQ